jgi:hypothetical protein
MVKSSTVLKYMGQYGFLVAGIGWIGKSVFDTVQGLLTSDWKTDEIIINGTIGLVHLAAFLYFRNKFVVAEFKGQSIRIIKDKEVIETSWTNVETLAPIPQRHDKTPNYRFSLNSNLRLLWAKN